MMKNVLNYIEELKQYKYTKLCVKIISLAFAVIVLSLPHLFRRATWLLPGDEAYYFLSNKGTIGVLIKILSRFGLETITLAKVLPFIFGLLVLWIFISILFAQKQNLSIILLSTIILIVSPNYIYLFSTLNSYFIPITFSLLIFYLLLLDKRWLVLPIVYIISLFGLIHLIAAYLIILFIKKTDKALLTLSLPSIIIWRLFSFNNFLPSYGSFIADFGGRFGLSLLVIILALFGFLVLWKKKKYQYFIFYSAIIFILIASVFDIRMLSYLNLILVFLAALGIISLIKKDWRSQTIKQLTVFILLCGMIFSGLSYINMISNELPNDETLYAIDYLREKEHSNVFSHSSRNHWIMYADKRPINHDKLFYVRDIVNASDIINYYEISYIWLDKDLETRLWSDENEGLQFLLKYSTEFKPIYENKDVNIWEVRLK